MALLEAMASGCPVIASRVGGIPEVIERESSGVLVRPQSEEDLVEGLCRLAGDSQLRTELGAGARRRVEKEFALSGLVENREKLYLSLLEGSRSS